MIILPGHLCGMGPESCRQIIFLMIHCCTSSLISFLCRFSTAEVSLLLLTISFILFPPQIHLYLECFNRSSYEMDIVHSFNESIYIILIFVLFFIIWNHLHFLVLCAIVGTGTFVPRCVDNSDKLINRLMLTGIQYH